MPARRKTTAEKKLTGTYNVTLDRDSEFVLLDGIVMAEPVPPKDFNETMKKEWSIAWKHLIAHEYGKAADVKLVEMYVRCLWLWEKSVKQGESTEANKWHTQTMKTSEALGLNPAAMAKVAILQKKSKTPKEKLDSILNG